MTRQTGPDARGVSTTAAPLPDARRFGPRLSRVAPTTLLRAMIPLSLMLAGCALDGPAPRLSAPLDEDQATHIAAKFLEGTEYAEDYVGALGRLEDPTLAQTGRNDCGLITTPTWTFHVHKPHEGTVYVDAGTGKVSCSSLPFLRV